MGKYVVIKDILNVRNQPKIMDTTWVGSLNKGTVLDLDENLIPGDTPAGTTDNTWRTDLFNRVVANAGVAPKNSFAARVAEFEADGFSTPFVDGATPDDQTKWRISWGHVDLGIWKIWKDFGTKGEGVKVVVIDDGAWSTDNDLKVIIGAESQSLVDTDTTVIDNSSPVHGTACAGLIGANGANCNVVFGVAPACDLVVIKAGTPDVFAPGNLNVALDKACQMNADIVSISRGTFVSNPNFPANIQKCVDKGILVCCGAGDTTSGTLAYPASTPGSFSVGAYLIDGTGQRSFNTKTNSNDLVTFLAPGNNLLSASRDASPYSFDATSAATAFAAGMFALVRACIKNKIVNTDTLKKALMVTGNYDQASNPGTPFKGCIVPNIYQIINYLKQ